MKRGRYYLGRVIKTGTLDQEKLIAAFNSPQSITVGKFQWTFTDTVNRVTGTKGYVFSRLSKYSREGRVKVVDTNKKSQEDKIEENLLVESSPFVYLPEYSGIAYLHVWNNIDEYVFRSRFRSLVEAVYDNFFVNCEIRPISDYKAFASKLKGLTHLSEIQARVQPPNPLFGDLWKDLNKYIKDRNSSEVKVSEKSEHKDGISTNLVAIIEAILNGEIAHIEAPASIIDAALLMAADGYGKGKVVGKNDKETVEIRTSETQKSFLFDKDPQPPALAEKAEISLEKVSQERNMQH